MAIEPELKITKEEFIAKLLKFAPWAGHFLTNEKLGLPKVCEIVAVFCFIEQVPESEFTEALRYQLLQMKHYGKFRFDTGEDTHEGVIIR